MAIYKKVQNFMLDQILIGGQFAADIKLHKQLFHVSSNVMNYLLERALLHMELNVRN